VAATCCWSPVRQVRDLPASSAIHYIAQRGGHGSGQQRRGADGEQLRVPGAGGTQVARWRVSCSPSRPRGYSVLVAPEASPGVVTSASLSRVTALPDLPKRASRRRALAPLGNEAGSPTWPRRSANAGKSSLLGRADACNGRGWPPIVHYHRTQSRRTGSGEEAARVADIPGLVEGASAGVGLGHDSWRT